MPDALPSLAARAPWVLALDAGSSSVRASLYDRAGRPLEDAPPARRGVAWRASPEGAMEADGETLLESCLEAVDGAMAVARERRIEVAAVGVCAFWHGVMGLGADGRPVTPLYGWGDTRAREDAAALRGRVDAEAAHGRTGCFVHEVYPAAKLVWLRRTLGDTFPRVAAWGSLGELLARALFGARRTSVSMASGTGLLDARALRWDGEMLTAAGVSPETLPEVSDAPLAGLLPAYARRWPELAAVPWMAALGDGACASLGSGACGRRLALTVGTSAAVRVLRETAGPVVPPGLWCYRLDARRAVWGRALSNAGNVHAWLRRTLRLPEREALDAALASPEARAHGLTVHPELVGERPPLEAGPGAAVAGLTLATTPEQIARAWLEAAAERIGEAVRATEAVFGEAEEIVAGGGALHASPAWARMIARTVGRPMWLAADAEVTARGAALLALERIGALEDALEAERPPGIEVAPEEG